MCRESNMEVPADCIQLGDLLNTERQIVDAYLPLIQELFAIAPSPDGDKLNNPTKYHRDLKRFLEMFVAIFRTTSANTPSKMPIATGEVKDNPELLEYCMKKFHDAYRRHYRNVHYLSSNRLQEIRHLAEKTVTDMIPTQSEISTRLRELISEEGAWVERINTCKREKIINSIRIDTIDDFRHKIESEFPLLNGDSQTDFYEENWFESQRNKMLRDITADFKDHIPRETTEDSFLMQEITSAFHNDVKEKVMVNLNNRNAENVKNVRSLLELTVDRAVSDYTKQMSTFVESMSLGQSGTLLDRHEEVKKNCRPSFPNKIATENSGVLDLEMEFVHLYEMQVHESYRQMKKIGEDNAKKVFQELEDEGKTKLAHCIKDCQDLLGVYHVPQQHIDLLQERLEQAFTAVLEGVKADIVRVDFPVPRLTLQQILHSKEKYERGVELKAYLEKCKQAYVEKLECFIRRTPRTFSEIQKEHQKIKFNLGQEMETSLIGKIEVDESVDEYIKKIFALADMYWEERYNYLRPCFGNSGGLKIPSARLDEEQMSPRNGVVKYIISGTTY